MRIIKVTDRFEKRLLKLPAKVRDKAYLRLDIFKKDSFSIILRNHSLRGCMEGKRSISVTGDVRIVFMEENNYDVVYILDIGTHSQIY